MENILFKDNEVLFKALADDFIKAVSELRKAEEQSSIEKSLFMDMDEEEHYYEEHEKRMHSLTSSKDYINITRKEYWENILKAKIEVIEKIGGFKMMQEFDTYLYNHPKDDELKLYNAFDYLADGVGGWCR